MFLMRTCRDNIIIYHWRVWSCIWFLRKDNLICLLLQMRIKLHFGKMENHNLEYFDYFLYQWFLKSEVLSAKILHIGIIPSGKSFTYIKNKRRHNTDSCVAPKFIFLQYEFWPFKRTLCFWSVRYILIKVVTHLQLHKALIWIETLYAKLCQKL